MQTHVKDYTVEMSACADAIQLKPAAIVLPEDKWVTLGDIDFHYLDWGNAHLPHLVLLHGGALTAHTWDMASLLLREKFHIVALDQRGHGDSGWTPEEQFERDNGDLMLEDTRAFLEHLGYESLVLCGMSMGGMNAIRYAARYPERLASLVIVDVAPTVMQLGVMEMEQFRRETETMSVFEDFVERAIRFNPQRHPAHLRYSLLHSLKPVADGWTWKQDHRSRPQREQAQEAAQAVRERQSQALWEDVRAIRTRSLLQRGANSKILAPDVAQQMVAAMADCELVVIPDAGHSVQGDNPKAFAASLERFALNGG
jgi:pimeloyl-ACP methyl ester carboxylesterase